MSLLLRNSRRLDNQFNHAFKNFGGRWYGPVHPTTSAERARSFAGPGDLYHCERSGVIADIEAVATIAKRAGVPLIVDARPACKPIDFLRISWHSLIAGGHGNSIGGLIADAGLNWPRGTAIRCCASRVRALGIVLRDVRQLRLRRLRVLGLRHRAGARRSMRS
jgi:hypothetical protein